MEKSICSFYELQLFAQVCERNFKDREEKLKKAELKLLFASHLATGNILILLSPNRMQHGDLPLCMTLYNYDAVELSLLCVVLPLYCMNELLP